MVISFRESFYTWFLS